MNLKVNGEYLDFNDTIEVEKKIKLFEEISTTDGDVSFAFDVPNNPVNAKILTYPFPDVSSKEIYIGLDCDIINFGSVLYSGKIRVEAIRKRIIQCSFIAGNANWFSLITGTLQELDLSEYDEELTQTNIINSWTLTEGVKYPLVDSGSLAGRSDPTLVIDDFVPFLYVKTVFKKIFQSEGIKIHGELIDDPIYNNLLVSTNNVDANGISTRSTYAGKDSTQNIGSVETTITFPVETDPYFDGDENLFDGSQYTADVDMIVDIAITFTTDYDAGIPANPFAFLKKNSTNLISLPLGDAGTRSFNLEGVRLSAGDTIEVSGDTFSGAFDVNEGSFRVTPRLVYFTYGISSLPNWSKQKFVSNILRMFNVISAYDPFSKTITFNLFEKIKDKTYIYISDYVSVDETNYESFVGNYAKRNLLSYQQPDIEEISNYNKKNEYEFGTGVIAIENNFIEEESDMIEVDFSVPFGYYSLSQQMHLEKLNINTTDDIRSFNVTSVTDASGAADIQLPADHGILAGDIVQIKDSTVASYNGVHVVNFSDSNSIRCSGLDFSVDADLTLVHQRIVRSTNDDVFLLIDSGPTDNADFSGRADLTFQIGTSTDTVTDNPSFAFFNMLDNGYVVNDFYKSGLSFGEINAPNNYQRTIVYNYWRLFNSICNDPAVLLVNAYLPLHIFMVIDFLAPVYIKTLQTNNLWYVNRITGYKGIDTPCQIELIKL